MVIQEQGAVNCRDTHDIKFLIMHMPNPLDDFSLPTLGKLAVKGFQREYDFTA